MSHANLVYAQPAIGGSRLARTAWQIREEDGSYAGSPLDLTDAVIDRLLKAEAVAWVLHDANADSNVTETAAVIADLIHEALEAHRELWEQVRGLRGH